MSRVFLPVALTEADQSAIAALKAIAKGNANKEQQVNGWRFIRERLCAVDDLSYRPDDMGGERDTAFHEGRRFVGFQMAKLETIPVEVLLGKKVEEKPARRSVKNRSMNA